MNVNAQLTVVMILALLAASSMCCPAKSGSVIVTAQMRANALVNVERYDWAAAQQQRAISAAARWVEMSDEDLWRMVPSQWVPRNCGVHKTAGCPACGDEFFKVKAVAYNRWAYDSAGAPWKLKCKNCGQLFPANDFGAYYQSGLDDRGEFDPEKADADLLFNPEHPNADDPDHLKWVDDGFGLKYGEDTLMFIAHYSYWLWRETTSAARTLANAYAVTGEPIYAHKAAVLLDRYADIYPNIDYSFVAENGWDISDGGSNKGMILGRIWETGTASDLSWAYDVVYERLIEDEELVEFCAAMRRQYPGLDDKPTGPDIARHVEDNLVTLFAEAVIEQRIRGNPGAHQRAMAMTAISLDDPASTGRYLDWLFEPKGGGIPAILVDQVCREGPSYEAAPGYSLAPRSLCPVADLLRAYEGYSAHDLYRDYPKMKQVFMACEAFRCLNQVTPKIGDSGKYQNWNETVHPVATLLSGYRAYRSQDIADQLWHSARYDLGRLEGQLNIFDENPQAIIDELVARKPELPIRLESVNHSGYGLAILQTENPDNGRCAYLYYGRSCGSHPHKDRLTFGIFAKHFVMNPDLAYPEYTGGWPKRHAWTNHTVSHNTVLVNDRKQTCNWGGKTELFSGGDLARFVVVDGGAVYDNVTTYERALGLVDVSADDSYIVDVFWVRGGVNHRMVNNGAGRAITSHNLQLTDQATGTFAGPDVEFGQFYDEDAGWRYGGSGFMYLRDVQRGNATADSCWMDWDLVNKTGEMAEDRDPHLRMHCLSPVDEIAVASGEPPHHRYNDDWLRYVVRSRLGEGIESQFVTVHEPYEFDPFIASVEPLALDAHEGEGFAAAMRVNLADGRHDVIIIAESPGHIEAGGVSLDGQVGFVRIGDDGQVEAARLVRGTALVCGEYRLDAAIGEITGRLTGFDVTDWEDNLLEVEPSVLQGGVTTEDLIGRHIIVANAERSDGCYVIRDVRENGTVISLGDMTLIERFVDASDYDQGYVYNVAEGDEFTIILSATSN
jgi:hypothetical protein